MLSRINSPSKPMENPTITEARIKVIKGWILNLAMAMMIKIRTAKIIKSKFIN
jgi:hypothetical protein